MSASKSKRQQTLSDVYGQKSEAVEDGSWIILRPATAENPALRVKLRSIHSKKVRREDQKLDRQYRVQYIAGNGVLDPETQDEKDVTLAARAILTGWEGFIGDDGKELSFTVKVAMDTLREFPQLRREIFILSRQDENFRSPEQDEAERKELGKN